MFAISVRLVTTRCACISQLTPSVFEGLRSWQSQNRLKQAVLQLLAKELNETDIIQLRKTFEAFDRNGRGTISVDELKQSKSLFLPHSHRTSRYTKANEILRGFICIYSSQACTTPVTQ